jgi:hypothetical protein
MALTTTAAPGCSRLAAPVATRLRGPCLAALSPCGVRRPTSTIHDHPSTATAERTI